MKNNLNDSPAKGAPSIFLNYNPFNSIIVSGLRILAVFGIYIFHMLSLYNLDNYRIDVISIIIFCFLSGFLVSKNINNPYDWLKKRTLLIILPYWIVIIPALFFNRIVGYKETTILGDFVTFLGGNMFLDKKVYVIAWYITFIMLLYLFIFFQSFFQLLILKFFYWGIGFIIFSVVLNKTFYFIAFAIGFLVSVFFSPPKKIESGEMNLAKILFLIQGYGYDFFLVHGGVLVFLTVILKLSFTHTFIFGIIISALCSLILHSMSLYLFKKLI